VPRAGTMVHFSGCLGLSRAPCVRLGFLGCLCFELCSLALWRVCVIAPSFVSGWRPFLPSLYVKVYFSENLPVHSL
jgi:hypothetical protein